MCFLLVDLYLLTFQPEKALHLLAVLDKLSAHGNNKNSKGEVCSCAVQMYRRQISTTVTVDSTVIHSYASNNRRS